MTAFITCDVCGGKFQTPAANLSEWTSVDGSRLLLSVHRDGAATAALVCDPCHDAMKDTMSDREAVADAAGCAECEHVRNHPDPYQRRRACEDCEDGDGHLGANHD